MVVKLAHQYDDKLILVGSCVDYYHNKHRVNVKDIDFLVDDLSVLPLLLNDGWTASEKKYTKQLDGIWLEVFLPNERFGTPTYLVDGIKIQTKESRIRTLQELTKPPIVKTGWQSSLLEYEIDPLSPFSPLG